MQHVNHKEVNIFFITLFQTSSSLRLPVVMLSLANPIQDVSNVLSLCPSTLRSLNFNAEYVNALFAKNGSIPPHPTSVALFYQNVDVPTFASCLTWGGFVLQSVRPWNGTLVRFTDLTAQNEVRQTPPAPWGCDAPEGSLPRRHQPKAFPLRAAWAPCRLLLRTGRSRLKMVSWSLSSSDSDIIRLELCSVLRCLIPAQMRRVQTWTSCTWHVSVLRPENISVNQLLNGAKHLSKIQSCLFHFYKI